MKALVLVLVLQGCTTTHIEVAGECLVKHWALANITMRRDWVCDLPPEIDLRRVKPLDRNPYEDFIEERQEASPDAQIQPTEEVSNEREQYN